MSLNSLGTGYEYTIDRMSVKSINIFDNVFIQLSIWHFRYYGISEWVRSGIDWLDGSGTFNGIVDNKTFWTRKGAENYAKKKGIKIEVPEKT